MKKNRCIIFGATGKVGRLLVSELVRQKYEVVALGRYLEKLETVKCKKIYFDFQKMKASLEIDFNENDIIINAAHSCYTENILSICNSLYRKFILIGSTRKFSKINAPEDIKVRKAEDLLRKKNSSYIVLHPTMIYGKNDVYGIQRIVRIASLTHLIPLPGGLQSRIQPIHVDDVVSSIISAVRNDSLSNTSINIGGPEALTYRSFIKQVCFSAGIKVYIFSIPYYLVCFLAFLSRVIPKVPFIKKVEIDRLYEDKAINISDMKKKLGVYPRTLLKGLESVFCK